MPEDLDERIARMFAARDEYLRLSDELTEIVRPFAKTVSPEEGEALLKRLGPTSIPHFAVWQILRGRFPIGPPKA